MKPMYPIVPVASQGVNQSNDARHNKVDPNSGGGPTQRTRRMVPSAKRGGFGQHGQARQADAANSHRGPTRAGASNPAGRGGTPGSFRPHAANPRGGGGVAARTEHRGMQRQFGQSGKTGVVNQYRNANPKPGAGNLSGRMARRIAGRFNNKSKGGNDTGIRGAFGSAPVQLSD